MLEKMMQTLIPLLITKIAAIDEIDKLEFASMLSMLCDTYTDNDPELFASVLAKTTLPTEWQTSLVKALWPNEDQG